LVIPNTINNLNKVLEILNNLITDNYHKWGINGKK
jgi:hypothetical protein